MTVASIIHAPPAGLPSLDECFFYHCLEVPGLGLQKGQWDLRSSVEAYLGGDVDFSGQRVLEVGPANGFLTFWMEGQGARVVGLELASGQDWDLVPYAGVDNVGFLESRRALQRRLQRAFWLAHDAFGSSAGLTHESIYDVSPQVGEFDIATFGMVLLHVRDPLQALGSVLGRVRKTAIVTEMFPWSELPHLESGFTARTEPWSADGRFEMPKPLQAELLSVPPAMFLLPRASRQAPKETWWLFTPSLVGHYLAVLGFEQQRIVYHYQPHDPRFQFHPPEKSGRTFHPCFTLVAERR
ncbi:MAG: hypothetical protein AAF725_18655 [Acidobacteriota bacterium]